MRRAIKYSFFLAGVFSVFIQTNGADWTQFRGPRYDNSFPGEKLPAGFGPEKNLTWKIPISSGQGSPCVVGERIFLSGFDGKETLETFALDRRDGKILWRRSIKPEKIETYFAKLGTPAPSTCASDGKHVVTYFGSYGLLCHDLEGKELWKESMPLPETRDGFGSGSSPIIHDGLVYLLRDEVGPGQGLYAFDVRDGKLIWKRKRDGFHVSFGSPVIWDGGVVCLGDIRVKSYDPKTGADRWSVRGLAAYPCTTPAPASDGNLYIATWSNGSSNERNMPDWKDFLASMDKDKDGKVTAKDAEGTWIADFYSIFDKNKSGLIEADEWQGGVDFLARGKNVVLGIKPGGRGDVTETHVLWTNEKGAPYVASPLFYQGRLYLVKDGGLLTVYEAATGKVLVDRERLGTPGEYYASPIAADGKVLIASQTGTVIVLNAGEKAEVLAKIALGESIGATPVLAEDTLFVRTAGHLWAFREPAAGAAGK